MKVFVQFEYKFEVFAIDGGGGVEWTVTNKRLSIGSEEIRALFINNRNESCGPRCGDMLPVFVISARPLPVVQRPCGNS